MLSGRYTHRGTTPFKVKPEDMAYPGSSWQTSHTTPRIIMPPVSKALQES